MDVAPIINQIAQRSAQKEQPGDYRKEGLLYCGKCHSRKERNVAIGGRVMRVGVMCRCQNSAYLREQEEERARAAAVKVKQLRAECIKDRGLEMCRFERAKDSQNIRRCRKFVENWSAVKRENLGMVFYGAPDGGKTFAAACIANALIDKGVPVMVTSFPKILAISFEERAEIVGQLGRYSLLIIDDLGVERESRYAFEQVYTVIDERIKSKLPMIVTTNLSLEELKNPKDIERARIYDRLMEVAVPVYFPPGDFRKAIGAQKKKAMAEIFGREARRKGAG